MCTDTTPGWSISREASVSETALQVLLFLFDTPLNVTQTTADAP